MRQEAQFELVNRGGESIRQFKAVALDPEQPRLARIHAMWGMGQLARKDSYGLMELKGLAPLLGDADDEIRAQVIKLLGEHPNPYADHAALRHDVVVRGGHHRAARRAARARRRRWARGCDVYWAERSSAPCPRVV